MTVFTPLHRGGRGEPLVCLHGFMETWRSWDLVLPAFERVRDVLAPTLPGHAGAAPIGAISDAVMADAVESAMDAAGFASAHVVGNSLGGYVALQLAERGRARSVVALAPAGGWAAGDDSYRELLGFQRGLQEQARVSAPFATPEELSMLVSNWAHIPEELVVHEMIGIARCGAAAALLEKARVSDWAVDVERITCPVRIVWGTADKLLPWPSAAARYRELLPHADWIELDGVGHAPQLDVPLEAAELILGFTS